MNISIQLSELQTNALLYFAEDGSAWLENALTERCRVAIEEITSIALTRAIEGGVQLPVTREEIVALAFENGWVKTAAQRKSEAEARLAAEQAGE